jgi:hypothetical protein
MYYHQHARPLATPEFGRETGEQICEGDCFPGSGPGRGAGYFQFRTNNLPVRDYLLQLAIHSTSS